uniref:Uncharacterized protein n=1 Tax=Knipowitschia caucasica TaxID=637954 RepID=A0AAV2JH54_KNICA
MLQSLTSPPGLAQSGLAQPGLGQPGLGQPGLGQSGLAPSGLAQPGLVQSGLANPITSHFRLPFTKRQKIQYDNNAFILSGCEPICRDRGMERWDLS